MEIESFRLLMAMYRCEHCGKVTVDPIMLRDFIYYRPSIIRSVSKRRYEKQKAKLEARLDRDMEQLLNAVEARDFKGKWLQGMCSYCHKKQSWTKLTNPMLIYGMGLVMVIMGVLCCFAARSEADNTVLQAVAGIMIVGFLGGGLALIIKEVWDYLRAARTCRESPVLLARDGEDLKAKAAMMPRYLTELSDMDKALLNGEEYDEKWGEP